MNLRLQVVQGRSPGKALVFSPGEYYLGRGEECHVRFNSDWISRQHCRLDVTETEVTLSDLGSRNGTLINGQLVREAKELREGDQVQIGPVTFEVKLDRPAPAAPSPPVKELIHDADQSEDEIPMDSTAHLPALPPEEPDAS